MFSMATNANNNSCTLLEDIHQQLYHVIPPYIDMPAVPQMQTNFLLVLQTHSQQRVLLTPGRTNFVVLFGDADS